MFTGIVQVFATVESVITRAEMVTWRLSFPSGYLAGITVGASVSLNGCCLTVTAVESDAALFDLVPETIGRTSFSNVKVGDRLNAERSLRFGDEVGGHLLSGHVDTVATVVAMRRFEHSMEVTFAVPQSWSKYVFEKGYIALQGASLTVTNVDRERGEFKVSLIPETLSKTTFGACQVGDLINLEIDRATQAVVETVERVLAERRS